MNVRLSLPKIPLILSITLINCVNICIAEEAIKTYHAVYQVELRGKIIGTSELSVQPGPDENTYRFTSKMVVHGMLRLLQPNPILEHTDFIYEKNRIRPTEFWSQNTNGEEKNDLHIIFNWDRGIATTTEGEAASVVEIQDNVLDRGSMQVAMMRDLSRGIEPGPYMLVDGDSLKTYRYTYEGEATQETPLGMIITREYTQQRDNSTRRTSIWLAPELSYLPVRIEQKRSSQTYAVFVLQSVKGLKK